MSTSKHVLVTGATGQQGGAVVQALLARGHRVRGLTRKAHSPSAKALEAQGVEIAVGDFTDSDSLVRAATGVDTIFAMTTPFEQGVEAETAQGLVITDAAKRAGVGHLVYSSVASADRETGIPHFDSKYAVEKAIRSSGVPHSIIAPVDTPSFTTITVLPRTSNSGKSVRNRTRRRCMSRNASRAGPIIFCVVR